MSAPKLVIFDCDGTLVDTERVGNQVLVDEIRKLGIHMDLDEALRLFSGRKMADTLSLVESRLGRNLPMGFLPNLREQMNLAFREHLEPMAGATRLVQRLAEAQIPICVASNGPHEKMLVSLTVTALLPYFRGKIFSAFDCGSWKPDPELFLFAAAQMGVSAEECVVIEDSLLGVRAGQRAGMLVYGYAPSHTGDALRNEGAEVFHHMEELESLLFNP